MVIKGSRFTFTPELMRILMHGLTATAKHTHVFGVNIILLHKMCLVVCDATLVLLLSVFVQMLSDPPSTPQSLLQIPMKRGICKVAKMCDLSSELKNTNEDDGKINKEK